MHARRQRSFRYTEGHPVFASHFYLVFELLDRVINLILSLSLPLSFIVSMSLYLSLSLVSSVSITHSLAFNFSRSPLSLSVSIFHSRSLAYKHTLAPSLYCGFSGTDTYRYFWHSALSDSLPHTDDIRQQLDLWPLAVSVLEVIGQQRLFRHANIQRFQAAFAKYDGTLGRYLLKHAAAVCPTHDHKQVCRRLLSNEAFAVVCTQLDVIMPASLQEGQAAHMRRGLDTIVAPNGHSQCQL